MHDTPRHEAFLKFPQLQIFNGGSSMAKSRLFQVFAFLAIVAFFVCAQQALAQAAPQSKPRFQLKILPKPQSQVHPNITEGLARWCSLFWAPLQSSSAA
jgi:hypothetical protein